MKIQLNIPLSQYKSLLNYLVSYKIPANKIKQNQIRKFIAQTLFDTALDNGNMDSSSFYDWLDERIGEKFKLKNMTTKDLWAEFCSGATEANHPLELLKEDKHAAASLEKRGLIEIIQQPNEEGTFLAKLTIKGLEKAQLPF